MPTLPPRVEPADPPDPPGVHLPQQARSRETFERILRAARGLLVEGGVEAVEVQEVVRRAEVGVGSFYARFEGREALIGYLHDRLWTDAERWWSAFLEPRRWEGAPLEAVAGELVRVLVRSHFQHEAELRAFWTRAAARPADRIMERTAEWDAAFVEKGAALLLARRDRIGHPRPERAARLGLFQLLATLRGHLFFPDSLPLVAPISLSDLVLELLRSLLSYVGAPDAPSTYRELLAASAAIGRR